MPENVTIGEVFRDYYETEHALTDIYRFLAVPPRSSTRETKTKPRMHAALCCEG